MTPFIPKLSTVLITLSVVILGAAAAAGMWAISTGVAHAQNASPLSPIVATTSPVTGITQRTYGTPFVITGVTTGLCLTLDSNKRLTSTSCGGFSYPFTTTGYGASTSTLLAFTNGIISAASSTFSSSVMLTALSGALSVDSLGKIYGTATGTVTSSNGISLDSSTRQLFGGSLAITGVNAAADAATKGVASFTANDFDATAGNISLDYTNGTAASAVAKGFLTSTDWSTFNSKQATIAATWPVILSGATLSFGGLSTSSAAVVGNLPYFSGVNTFANVATTSVTCGTGLSCTGFTAIGSSPITLTNTASGFSYPFAVTTYGGVVVNSTTTPIWIGATAATYGFLASSTLTTYASTTQLSVSGNAWITALTAGRVPYAGTAGLLSDSASFTWNNAIALLTATNASTTALSATGYFSLPTNASVAPTVLGQVAVDTTDDQLIIGNGTSAVVRGKYRFLTVPFSTTTAMTATSSGVQVGPAPFTGTFQDVQCSTDVGTMNFRLTIAGTDLGTKEPNASTTVGTFTYASANTFTRGNVLVAYFGTPASSPTTASCTLRATETAT